MKTPVSSWELHTLIHWPCHYMVRDTVYVGSMHMCKLLNDWQLICCLFSSGSELSPRSCPALFGLHHICWTWYEKPIGLYIQDAEMTWLLPHRGLTHDCSETGCSVVYSSTTVTVLMKACHFVSHTWTVKVVDLLFLLLSPEKEACFHLQCVYPVQALLLWLQPSAQEGTASAPLGNAKQSSNIQTCIKRQPAYTSLHLLVLQLWGAWKTHTIVFIVRKGS